MEVTEFTRIIKRIRELANELVEDADIGDLIEASGFLARYAELLEDILDKDN